jgi:hypothetical protein
LGTVHFWDLTMNSFMIVNAVMAIGLSVDYNAHIVHAYLSAPETNQDKDPELEGLTPR